MSDFAFHAKGEPITLLGRVVETGGPEGDAIIDLDTAGLSSSLQGVLGELIDQYVIVTIRRQHG